MIVLKKIKFLLLLTALFALGGCEMDGEDWLRVLSLALSAVAAVVWGIVYLIKAILPKKKTNPPASTSHMPPPLPTPIPTIENTGEAAVHELPKEKEGSK